MTPAQLLSFEAKVEEAFTQGRISGPVHLNSPSQAEPLLRIFQKIRRRDWVLSTWRGHWHALLHGVPRARVMTEVLAGRSMMLHFPGYRFMSSAIMGGMLPIACGLAAGGETVWCFVGDMCASTGAFADATHFAAANSLPINFIVEDNRLSTNTPTQKAWGPRPSHKEASAQRYTYHRPGPHYLPLPGPHGF